MLVHGASTSLGNHTVILTQRSSRKLTWAIERQKRKVEGIGTSLVVQWLRICLAMQMTQVQSPVG